MADKKSDTSRPPSSQGALLLMPASDVDTTAPASNILFPYSHSDASSLFPDDDAEADSFVGQSAACDQYKPQQFNYFAQNTASEIADPFCQIRQPEMQPSYQPLMLNKPSSLPQFSLAVTAPQTHSAMNALVTNANPYAAGTAIVSARPAHLISPESLHVSDQRVQPPNQLLQQSTLPVQPNFQTMPVTLSAPSAPNVLGGSGSSSFGSDQSVSSHGQHVATGMPILQRHAYNQASIGNNIPISTVQSASAALPSSIYPPMALPSSQIPQIIYKPVVQHWFYSVIRESRETWEPFSVADSQKIEEYFVTGNKLTLSVEGGRYDVHVVSRRRTAIYWTEESRIRRCSWFYRPEGHNIFVPFDEQFSANLEESYRNTIYSGDFHKRLMFAGGESIVIHNPQTVLYFSASAQPDAWGNTSNDSRPSPVKRGLNETDCIPDNESDRVDHLVLMVHGAGATCDLRMRNITECVNDFRSTSSQIMKSHFHQATAEGRAGRVEFLPVQWHEALHGDVTGVDRKLKKITLNSIKKLRSFTNDTLIDILFYGSPVYAQTIVETVGNEINRLVQLFHKRNPLFKGSISLSGHSLGALICFDLLMHQGVDAKSSDVPVVESCLHPAKTPDVENDLEDDSESETLDSVLTQLGLSSFLIQFQKEQIDLDSLSLCDDNDIKEMGLPLGPRKKLQSFLKEYKGKQVKKKLKAEQRAEQLAVQQTQAQSESTAACGSRDSSNSTSVSYIVGDGGIGAPLLCFPQLCFKPANFFALGSPIAMFLALRGIDSLGEDFHLATCAGFYNIFHPFDPVAYRIEPMIVQNCPPKPILIPHHQGRKRLHLELKESLARMGSDLKQRIVESVKATWQSIHSFAQAHKTSPGPQQHDDMVVEREVEDVLSEMSVNVDDDGTDASIASSVADEDELPLSSINQGRRVDYVLQEKPIEIFNDYLFALGSQTCYWQSEDTALLMLKEIYSPLGIYPLRPSAGGMFQLQSPLTAFQRLPAGPPPRAGFVPVPGTVLKPGSIGTPTGFQQGPRPPPANSYPVTGVRPSYDPHLSSVANPAPTSFSRSAAPANIQPPAPAQQQQQQQVVGPPPLAGFMKK